MDFLADENMPADLVSALRDAGHNVVWVRAESPGISDREVLAWAQRENRVVLTFDKDFGELAYWAGLSAGSGVILFRLPMPRSGQAGARLAKLIGDRQDWTSRFSVIEPGRIRMRDLPKVAG
jgi:hypothetical protein